MKMTGAIKKFWAITGVREIRHKLLRKIKQFLVKIVLHIAMDTLKASLRVTRPGNYSYLYYKVIGFVQHYFCKKPVLTSAKAT